MPLRVHVIVSGRVQNVWFRASTQQRARALGIGGWVQNLPDGRVEAVFEGENARVRRALDFIETGPPGARVDDVVVEEALIDEATTEFLIR